MPVLTNRTQACKMFRLVPIFFSDFFFKNTDESKLPPVTNIVIVAVAICHCHRDFRVLAFLRTLAAFTRLDDHVRKLFNLGCIANVVEDGQWFQILGHTARRSRCFGIYGVVQAKDFSVLRV